jgi:hypothetical protein
MHINLSQQRRKEVYVTWDSFYQTIWLNFLTKEKHLWTVMVWWWFMETIFFLEVVWEKGVLFRRSYKCSFYIKLSRIFLSFFVLFNFAKKKKFSSPVFSFEESYGHKEDKSGKMNWATRNENLIYLSNKETFLRKEKKN